MSPEEHPTQDETEGVIKFHYELKPGREPEEEEIGDLNLWRGLLYRLGLTGCHPRRYGGLDFGNLSLRSEKDHFWITGSQTAHKRWLAPRDYCRILAFDLNAGWVLCEGGIAPSSETLAHAAVYEADPRINCVMHVHSPEIWVKRERLGIFSTPADIPYGTPDMAVSVRNAVLGKKRGIICMAGHTDGVIAYGETPEISAVCIFRKLAKALARKIDK
jgi:hypothetical protein